MNNSHIKNAKALYDSNEYRAYLQLEFTKVGKEILKQISNSYKKVTNEAGEENISYISVVLDDTTLLTTYFETEISDGILQFSMGASNSNFESYKQTAIALERIVNIIELGKTPVKYTFVSDNFIQSNITKNDMMTSKIVFGIIVFLISIYLIFRYKLKGIISSILAIGYIGFFLIVIRYVNVYITINSCICFILILIMNYIFILKLLSELEKSDNYKVSFIKTIKKLYITTIPICIIAVVFTLSKSITVNSIGMTAFWGILLQVIYNMILSKEVYLNLEK